MSQKLKGRVAPNKIAHSLIDVDKNEVWKASSLKELSLICPISLTTLSRLKNKTAGIKIKSKYRLEIL